METISKQLKFINEECIKYLEKNKQQFFENFIKDCHKNSKEKIAYFTAGPSGAGKTEYAISILKKQPELVHIDTDKVRDFFEPMGYNGTNSDLYQAISSKGVGMLFDETIKEDRSFIHDTNFSSFSIAKKNIKKLEKEYKIFIIYIYNSLEKCKDYAKKREEKTKRKVPLEVIENTFIKSKETVYEIKKFFKESIIVILLDIENKKEIIDISAEEFKEYLSKGDKDEKRK